jgi:hypothetical protein
MLFDGSNPHGSTLSEDQRQWLEAMLFCDRMEAEHTLAFYQNEDPEQEVWSAWWENQAKACRARVQMNTPYTEKYW